MMPKLRDLLQNLGLLLWIGTVDQLLNILSWIVKLIQRHSKLSIHLALLGSSALLLWMTFRVAVYSAHDSLILFGLAATAFIAGIWPATNGRLRFFNH